ncbi:MAG: CRTAC1 family protein [Planctomycetota bacterium]
MRRSVLAAMLIGVLALGTGWMVWTRNWGETDARSDSPVAPSSRAAAFNAAPVTEEAGDSPIHFTLMTESSGIVFQHRSGNSPERPFPAANGSGIGSLDYDLDGNYDLYFATGRTFPLDQPDAVGSGNRLYRNDGHWKFADVTAAVGVGHLGYSAGIAVGDFDSDGFPDIYVSCFGPNVLYRNCGDGTFVSVGEAASVNDSRWGTSAAFFDYDGDGELDIYSCNYAEWLWETNQFCGNRMRGVRIFCSPSSVAPERHLLFHNEADGTFRETLHDAGIDVKQGRGQGVVAADINLDGLIDLYVGNDLQPNFLFLNAGGGRFRDASDESGAAYDRTGHVHAGMGVDAADMNGDGLPELFVTNFEHEYNTYYENSGHEQFQDVSESVGLAAASRPWVGWGTALVDLDGDGARDVIVTNGHTDDNLSEMGRDASYEQPPLVWRNRGRRFELVGPGAAGPYFAKRYPGRALSISDLDNDGDPDVIIGHQDSYPALLRNDRAPVPESQTNSITLRFIGRLSNRDAVGTSLKLESGTLVTYHQIRGGGSYLSAHDLRVIGICDGSQPANLEIRWPRGFESRVTGLASGSCYAIIEPHDSGQSPRIVEQFCTTPDGIRRLK